MENLARGLAISLLSTALIHTSSHSADIEGFDMQRCVNMGNSLEAPRDQPWGKPVNTDHFSLIKAQGFDTIRLPVRWSDYIDEKDQIEVEFLDHVENIIDEALAHDLNIILNIHHFEAIMASPASETETLIKIWSQVADRFQHHNDSLWFEVINEPHNQLKGDALHTVQKTAVETIRQSNPERIIILGGENWSGINSLGTNISPPDNNIVYTYHYYDPFDFTHQKAPWVGENGPKETRDWGSEKDQSDLSKAVEKALRFKQDIDRPVFVGEFGAYDIIENSERVQYVGDVRKALDDAQIPWCLWAFSNTFALYDEEHGGWDVDMLQALIPDRDVMQTQVISAADVTIDDQAWGQFLPYFVGDTDFTSNALTGVAIIKPGEEIHPPHKHIEEEFLMVLEGNGTWTIGDDDFPAKAGDILYAAPWDLHGIKNTGSVPLKFVVFKYNKR